MSTALIETLECRTMLSVAAHQPPPPAALDRTPTSSPHAVMVKDINPGPASSIGSLWVADFASEMLAVGNQVLFSADDGKHGITLWKSDGTASGTVMVRRKLGDIEQFTNMDDILYFVRNGRELWRSDGTGQGTTRVKDFGRSGVSIMGTFQGLLVLKHDTRLFTSDGTWSGTQLLRDLGPNATNIYDITVVGDRFFFTTHPQYGRLPGQLWVSDGTPQGTVLVKQIRGYLGVTDVVGQSVLVNVSRGYVDTTWISDGTPDGTHASPWTFSYHGTIFFDNKIYFIQEDNPAAGMYQKHYLWAADATLTTRSLVKAFPQGDDIFNMQLVYNGEVYFTLDDGVHGVELMKTDGTPSGTVLVKDIYGGGLGSYPHNLSILNGKLLFTATDAVHGTGVWSTDGTTEDTLFARTLVGRGVYLDVNHFYNSGTAIYITTVDGTVWKSNGTRAGTSNLGTFSGGRLSASSFTAAGGHVFFFAWDDRHGGELWMDP